MENCPNAETPDNVRSNLAEQLISALPSYLSPENKTRLFADLMDQFPDSTNPNKVYLDLESSNLFQGDCLIDIPFHFILPETGVTTHYCDGIILSNSCDCSQENITVESKNIVFSKIYVLKDYLNLLRSYPEITDEKIKTFLVNLKSNKISNLFFLPELNKSPSLIFPESFVRFDETSFLPSSIISKYNYNYKSTTEFGDRLFSLSQYGFYLLVYKLSLHFCRFREGIERYS